MAERGEEPNRRQVAIAGHTAGRATVMAGLAASDEHVRASAIAALARLGSLGDPELAHALADASAVVRRRACQMAGRMGLAGSASQLVGALADKDPHVAESACAALGELGEAVADAGGVAQGLAVVAGEHADPLCREAAVAALGAIGNPLGLPAVLAACTDKPAVRRRAVIALAAFEGDDVEAALTRALGDADWQVRQAAEDLVGRQAGP